MPFLHKDAPPQSGLAPGLCISPKVFHICRFQLLDSFVLPGRSELAARRSGLFQQQRKQEREHDSKQQRCKRNLVMLQFHLRCAARYSLKDPSENRSKQCAKSKIKKIDYACCCAAVFLGIRFFNNGVRKHGRARSKSCDKAKHVGRENARTAKQNPRQASEEHESAGNDHWFPPPQSI